MSYEKTVWTNGSTPAINATNLNKIEQGIYDLNNLPNFRKRAKDIPISLQPNSSIEFLKFDSLTWWLDKEYDNSPDKVSNGMIDQNGNIVIRKSGKYRILFTTQWVGGNGGEIGIEICRNNTNNENVLTHSNAIFPLGGMSPLGLTVSAQTSFQLNQGDILYFMLYHYDQNTVTVKDISVCIECFELI